MTGCSLLYDGIRDPFRPFLNSLWAEGVEWPRQLVGEALRQRVDSKPIRLSKYRLSKGLGFFLLRPSEVLFHAL